MDHSYSDHSSATDPIYESCNPIMQSDPEDDSSLMTHHRHHSSLITHHHAPIMTSSLASKSSISNMSTGQSSECSSSDSYHSTSPSSSPTHKATQHSGQSSLNGIAPTPKKKRGLMTSLKRSLSFSQKRKNRPTRNVSLPSTLPTQSSHAHPNYEKPHDFKVNISIWIL